MSRSTALVVRKTSLASVIRVIATALEKGWAETDLSDSMLKALESYSDNVPSKSGPPKSTPSTRPTTPRSSTRVTKGKAAATKNPPKTASQGREGDVVTQKDLAEFRKKWKGYTVARLKELYDDCNISYDKNAKKPEIHKIYGNKANAEKIVKKERALLKNGEETVEEMDGEKAELKVQKMKEWFNYDAGQLKTLLDKFDVKYGVRIREPGLKRLLEANADWMAAEAISC